MVWSARPHPLECGSLKTENAEPLSYIKDSSYSFRTELFRPATNTHAIHQHQHWNRIYCWHYILFVFICNFACSKVKYFVIIRQISKDYGTQSRLGDYSKLVSFKKRCSKRCKPKKILRCYHCVQHDKYIRVIFLVQKMFQCHSVTWINKLWALMTSWVSKYQLTLSRRINKLIHMRFWKGSTTQSLVTITATEVHSSLEMEGWRPDIAVAAYQNITQKWSISIAKWTRHSWVKFI